MAVLRGSVRSSKAPKATGKAAPGRTTMGGTRSIARGPGKTSMHGTRAMRLGTMSSPSNRKRVGGPTLPPS